MKRKGASKGITTKLRPQVHILMQTAIIIVTSIENEIMKHPPFIGQDACIVIIVEESPNSNLPIVVLLLGQFPLFDTTREL